MMLHVVLLADGGFRGAKTIALKEIADEALTLVQRSTVVGSSTYPARSTMNSIDKWWHEELEKFNDNCRLK